MDSKEYRLMYDLEDRHWWFLAKRLFVQAAIPKFTKKISILDIGSGTGGMTKFLSHIGTVQSVEPSSDALPYLKRRGIKPIRTSIDDCSFPPRSFDLICICDVLYHQDIKNDTGVLRKAYSWLKPKGYLCITDCAVPLLRSPHDTVMHARQRYWLSELIDKTKSQHFHIRKASYIYFLTFPLFIIQRTMNTVIPFETVGEIPYILNHCLFFFCRIESILLRYIRFPIGSSVIVVGQKP